MTPLRCVVDASVGIKLCVTEDLSDQAARLFSHLMSEPSAEFYVPDLFYVECTNILWKHVRRFGLPVEHAQQGLADLSALFPRSVPTATLAESAFEIAIAHGTSAYDACYVALADRLGVDLITADERLARTLQGTPFSIRCLGDMPELSSSP